MQDIVIVALIVGFGLMFLGRLFSSPPQPPTITYIPVIREPAAPQLSGCGTLLVAAALDRYLATVVSDLLAHVEQPDAGLSEIQAYFGRLVAIAHTAAGEIGCLMCNSTTELAPHDSVVAAKVDTYVQRLTSAFRGALINAQQLGELDGLLDVDAAAHYLTGTVIGISVYAKTPVQRASIAQYAQLALSLLAPGLRQ
jgi:TetR/AcrR family transcriptional repressor of nem operon